MPSVRYPSLYQINTRVWVTDLSRQLGREATLDDIPDAELDRLADRAFDWVWLLSVWRTGLASQQVSRSNPEWRREYQETLPDLQEEDIGGSGFAITGYTVHTNLGGDEALARLRQRLQQRGLRLMLDFVPNHTGLDHPWVEEYPEHFIRGTERDLERSPQNYTWVKRQDGELLLAHGRDPNFPGWPDTLQLNYATPETQEAMIGELMKIAGQCDGVRCDMAMLVLPEVFERTWGQPAPLFWPTAIQQVREKVPNFCFMAEVYWDLEWTLQQQGFDYTYDKHLYDRLRTHHARPVRNHFQTELDYQDKLACFLENHDEPRAAATFSPDVHQAAAVLTFLSPGLRFFHQGQFTGRKKRIPAHLCRAPEETPDQKIEAFYDKLLAVLRQPVVRDGDWQLLDCVPAWKGNWTWECVLAFAWQTPEGEMMLVTVNYTGNQSQCYVQLPFADLEGREWQFQDQLADVVYIGNGDNLKSAGLYLDLLPWQTHVFSLQKISCLERRT